METNKLSKLEEENKLLKHELEILSRFNNLENCEEYRKEIIKIGERIVKTLENKTQ